MMKKDTGNDARIRALLRRVKGIENRLTKLEQNKQIDTTPSISFTPKIDPYDFIGCGVCGLNSKDAMGYVCPRSDCPTRVTCG